MTSNILFKSFEDALNFASGINGTHFERANDIRVLHRVVFLDTPDLKLVWFYKSDNQKGLTIFFKTSTKHDTWLFWYPSENQANLFSVIHELYLSTNKANEKVLK